MNENVNVCITPKGDKPVLHFSQFDNENVFTVTVLADDGESAAVLTGLDIEFRLRKTDSHVVTVAPESVTDNVITFKTTEQMCACCGQNIATVALMKDDMIISTLDILVEIQRDIMSGGLTSESDIRNLTTQIEQIVPEVIGDDYYTKDQVDELIADIPTFDPTNYYDKSDVDSLLADKADSDDVYTKAETDTLLADKADADNVYTKSETDTLLADKADADDVYTKSEADDLLDDKLDKMSGNVLQNYDVPIIEFNSDSVAPLATIKSKITPSAGGYNSINLTLTGKNLMKITATSTTISGVSYVVNEDSTITVNNTASGASILDLGTITLKAGNSYILTGCPAGGMGTTYALFLRGSGSFTQKIDFGGGISFTVSDDVTTTLSLIVYNNYTANDLVFSPMVRFAGTDSAYLPYQADPVTKTISLGDTVYGGTVDYTAGIATDDTVTPANVVTFTPVTLDTLNGYNAVFNDIGNMTDIEYFTDVDSLLVKLIRACMI